MKLPFPLFVAYAVSLLVCLNACKHEPLNPKITPDKLPVVSDTCSDDTVYFQNDILPILQSNCAFAGCHGNGSAQDGVDLTSYDKIINTADVRPFNSNNSDLYEAITEQDLDKRMPPPPYEQLSNENKEKIKKWINQGALNNVCSDCDTSNITFKNHVFPIIQSNCLGCHNSSFASGQVNLENYNQVAIYVNNGRLLGSIFHKPGFKPMPQGAKLSDCDLNSIQNWVDNGALNN